jgi:hypothetical protein
MPEVGVEPTRGFRPQGILNPVEERGQKGTKGHKRWLRGQLGVGFSLRNCQWLPLVADSSDTVLTQWERLNRTVV